MFTILFVLQACQVDDNTFFSLGLENTAYYSVNDDNNVVVKYMGGDDDRY